MRDLDLNKISEDQMRGLKKPVTEEEVMKILKDSLSQEPRPS